MVNPIEPKAGEKSTDMSTDEDNQKELKGVLFDMDGVLVDSEHFITRAGMEMFKEKGFQVNYDDFKEFTGMGENRFLGGVAEKYGIPFQVEKDKARTYEIYAGLIKGKLEPLPGVHDFIRKCKSQGLKIAVATAADRVKMELNLKEIGFSESDFDANVNGLEVENKKPDPDIFLKAAAKIGIQPQSCLVVEDAVSGVAAAKSAGCRCLALTTTFNKNELAEADWISNDLSDAPEECLEW